MTFEPGSYLNELGNSRASSPMAEIKLCEGGVVGWPEENRHILRTHFPDQPGKATADKFRAIETRW
jgi:hypothetical protein